jgi:putative ABC transport system permease protein
VSVSTILQTTAQEFRYAVRRLRKSPGFTVSAVLVMAIGIGSSTAVFSVVDRVLFRSLPYAEDSRLVSVGVTAPIERQEFMLGRQYFDWKDHQTPFTELTSWSGVADCDITAENPVRTGCARVESNFLATLGVQPLIGRNFTREEDRPNGPQVVIISNALWQGRFGGDPAVLGKTLAIDGASHTIVGALPREFELPTLASADIILPQKLDEAAQRQSDPGAVLSAFARLKPGVTAAQASLQLQPLFKDFLNSVPGPFRKEVRLMVRSIRDRQVHEAKTASWLLLSAVLAVLLIACANVANLLLARSASRQRELAVRSALGASRARLALLTIMESFSISVLGGAAGCLLAYALMRSFVAIAPEGIPHLRQAALDLRVLAFALLAALVSGSLFGLAPALQCTRPESLTVAHEVSGPRRWLRQTLIVGQIAGSLVLMFAAGLLLHSLWNIENSPLGISIGGVLTAEIALNQQLYRTPEQQLAFFEELEKSVRSMPGATYVALSDSIPPAAAVRSTIFAGIEVEGRPKFSAGTGGTVEWRAVTPDYFAALNIPIVQGRSFREQDRAPNTNVLVLGQSLAQRLFPGEGPIGKHMQVNNAPPWFTVAGVAADVRNQGILGADEPEYYLLRAHAPDYGLGSRMPSAATRNATLIVRTSSALKPMEQWLREEVHRLDPSLPVNIATLDQRVGALAQRPRFSALLLAFFAAMALLSAAVGLYGLVSFFVVQRTREIGVRMALGATPPNILRLVLGRATQWALAGLVIGAGAAVLTARTLGSMLFHVRAADPWLLIAATALLLSVVLAAAWVPARRAARLDPILALRDQ